MAKAWAILMIAIFATGCVTGPSMQNAFLSGQREAVYGHEGRKLHFVLVTDGRISEARNGESPLFGPFWEGVIQSTDPSRTPVAFRCTFFKMRIGGQTYALSGGRAFTVATQGAQPVIRQMPITPEEDIKGVLESDQKFQF